jgi:hypothetical protein
LRAQEVGAKKIKTARELATAMAEVVPGDATFEAAFAEARISHVFLARYFLRALELQVKEDDSPELIPNDEEVAINLEHVLPENPGNFWPEVSAEIAPAYYKRIGNMALLKAAKNSLIGSKSFKEKKPVLGESIYELTKEIAKYDEWGVPEISARQKRLAALAVKTWPIEVK